MRAGPSGEERGTPHYTVPVSPQCPQEISVLTLPVFQGAAVSSEQFSQSLPPGNRGAERLAALLGVSRAAVPCRSSASGHRASSSKYTRGQSRETGSLSRLFGSVESTAKCVSMGHAHCKTRLSQRSDAAFQRGHSHAGGSRAGSGNGTRSEHSPEEAGHRGGPSSRQRVQVPEVERVQKYCTQVKVPLHY